MFTVWCYCNARLYIKKQGFDVWTCISITLSGYDCITCLAGTLDLDLYRRKEDVISQKLDEPSCGLGKLHFRLRYDFDKSDFVVHLIEGKKQSSCCSCAASCRECWLLRGRNYSSAVDTKLDTTGRTKKERCAIVNTR